MTRHTFTFQTVGTPTPAHETLRVFVNGASAGLLTLRTDEVVAFKAALEGAAVADLADTLRSILADLPSKRDWLDPALEQRARDAVAKL